MNQNMIILKKINYFLISLLLILKIIPAQSSDLGTIHTFGISLIGSYEYEEPDFMNLRSGWKAEEDKLKNLGLTYNYKNSALVAGHLDEFEFDIGYQFLTQTYWSNGTGTMDDIDVYIFNSRILYGTQYSKKLMLKTGIGYRKLYHYWQDRYSTTGARGYDREQDYAFIPIIAELEAPIPELNLKGKLKLEFDHIFSGKHTAYMGHFGGGNKDLNFRNNDGYIWKVSYQTKYKDYILEPYYEFMSVEESDIDSGFMEPSNTTKEFGIKLSKAYSDKRKAIDDFETFFDNDEYYFGIKTLYSEVESGFYNPTGNASIDEKDLGYAFFSGLKLIDKFKNIPVNLNLEFAFNEFGLSKTICGNGDTLTTDGRFGGGSSAGTVITCANDNNHTDIDSYSTSVGLNAEYLLPLLPKKNLLISGTYGVHRWDQSETDFIPGQNLSTTDYSGVDDFYSIGLGIDYNNLTFGIEHSKHDMYYDATSKSIYAKYNF
jgi:hypothetical protein